MKSIGKLKDRARKYEQKEDWKAAIDAYRSLLDTEHMAGEAELELALFNRVGDLYLRLGQTDEAVGYYETAADKYAESGFYNNAIALCNKALRHRPERPSLYLKLSRFCHDQGFLTDARRWIIGYAERQGERGNVGAALAGLQEFADASGDPDVRELLAEHLASQGRRDEAIEQLRLAYLEWRHREDEEATGRVTESARKLDPDVELDTSAQSAPPAPVGLPGLDDTEEDSDTSAGLADLESHRAAGIDDEAGSGPRPEADPVGGLETFAPGIAGEEELETPGSGAGVQPVPDAGAPPEIDEPEPEPLPLLDTGFDQERDEQPEDLPLLETAQAATDQPEAIELEPEASELEPETIELEPMDLDLSRFGLGGAPPSDDPVAEHERDPDVDVDAVLNRAKELVSRGLFREALRELRLLSATDASPAVFRQALSVANEIGRHSPDDLIVLHRRVEFASRIGDRGLIVDTYLGLAEALARSGAETKARALYQRVLGLDPQNQEAREVLGDAAVGDHAALDLDALLRDLSEEGMASSPGHVPLELDEGFVSMLSQFKARVTDQDGSEDPGDHYDLGVAFKEMGLIDEAIGEFQTALTGGGDQLKVYEELAQCFILKDRHKVAIKILERALQKHGQGESSLLSIYYHLGKCHEELGQREAARAAYEEVMAIDPHFADVPSRVGRL